MWRTNSTRIIGSMDGCLKMTEWMPMKTDMMIRYFLSYLSNIFFFFILILLSFLDQINDTPSYMCSLWGCVSLHHTQSKMVAIQHCE